MKDISRTIPATLATQHPDNASIPYWTQSAFIDTLQEIDECYRVFSELGCQELMWDWEGKYADEALIDKLFASYHEFFRERQLGRDIFLLLRIPNIWEEKGYRLGRAFMSMVTAEDLADDLGLATPPILEVVLPMVDSADKLMFVHRSFKQVAEVEHQLFDGHPQHTRYINVLPLTETTENLLSSVSLLERYVCLHEEAYGKRPEYLRPFIARSDPALNSGMVPAVIGAKVALSEYDRFSSDQNIPCFPIVGSGSLPFRGGLSPLDLDAFLREYGGARTVTIQSAFRYDWPLPQVRAAIAKLNEELPKSDTQRIPPGDVQKLGEVTPVFQSAYRTSVEKLAATVNEFAQHIPERRERLLHVGIFGYSRAVGEKHLPRAITFTAVFYSLGVPPELIGSGRGIKWAREAGLLGLLERTYLNLKPDLVRAGRYLNKENLAMLASQSELWREVVEDVRLIEDYLGEELGPKEEDDLIHRNLTSNVLILHNLRQEFGPDLERAARLRRSLG